MVQVVKDYKGSPLGTKEAHSMSTNIMLPSCYLVFMPSDTHMCISHWRNDSNMEQERLKKSWYDIAIRMVIYNMYRS